MQEHSVKVRKYGACLVCCALVLVMCNGCVRPLAAPGHRYTQPIEHRANTNIVTVDNNLAGVICSKIQIARQRTEWTDDGRLQIFVEIENRTTHELDLEIQTAFKDSNDNFLLDAAPWTVVVLHRNQTHVYTATALSKDAAKAHVRLRNAAR